MDRIGKLLSITFYGTWDAGGMFSAARENWEFLPSVPKRLGLSSFHLLKFLCIASRLGI